MAFWPTPEDFERLLPGPLGLQRWHDLTQELFHPVESFIVSATPSDPLCAIAALPKVKVLNCGIQKTKPYDVIWHNYSLFAWESAFNYALRCLSGTLEGPQWDLLVTLDTDALVGNVDFGALLKEFLLRPELVLSPAWCKIWIGGPFMAFKPEACRMWLNNRKRANLVERGPRVPEPMLPEDEMTQILGAHWWNPWGNVDGMRQDFPEQAECHLDNAKFLTLSFVRKPHPEIIDEYLRTQSVKAKPVTSPTETEERKALKSV